MATEYGNHELYQCYKEVSIVKHIKINRLRSRGHLLRMNDESSTKKTIFQQPIGSRRKGRPNMRFLDNVVTIWDKNWRRKALSRETWNDVLEEVPTHRGVYSRKEGVYIF